MNRPEKIEGVIVHNGKAIIIGTPAICDWLPEDDPQQHNCDAMGCASGGPHVLARIPITQLRPMSEFGDSVRRPATNGSDCIYSAQAYMDPHGNWGLARDHIDVGGLTKREHFASLLMQALSSNERFWAASADVIAKWAVEGSDKLIAALSEPQEEG